MHFYPGRSLHYLNFYHLSLYTYLPKVFVANDKNFLFFRFFSIDDKNFKDPVSLCFDKGFRTENIQTVKSYFTQIVKFYIDYDHRGQQANV